MGFIHDYGEENVHLRDAFSVRDGKPLESFRYLVEGGFRPNEVDMVEIYKFRWMVYAPAGLSMKLLGPGDVSLSLWFITCSLLSVLLTYRLGRLLHDRATGLCAAVILAFVPFDVIWSSRVHADVVVSCFLLGSLCLILSSRAGGVDRRPDPRWLAAGLVLGLAYLAKITVLALAPAVLAVALFRRGRAAAFLVLAGFAVVLAAETLFYRQLTGIWFLRYLTARGAIERNIEEVFRLQPVLSSSLFTYHAYTDRLYYLRLVLNRTGQLTRDHYFSLWGWTALAGAAYSVHKRKLVPAALAGYLLLYFELGCSDLRFADGSVHYYQIFKEPKYLLVALPFFALLSASAWKPLWDRSRALAVPALAILLAASVGDARLVHARYQPALKDVKAAAAALRAEHPGEAIYVDPLFTDYYLRLFSSDDLADLRALSRDEPLRHGSLVLIGGTRGLHIASRDLLAFYAEHAPSLGAAHPVDPELRFELVRAFPASPVPPGSLPLRIYRVTCTLDPDELEPPVLEIHVEKRPGEIVLNGYVRAHGDPRNRAEMSLSLDGETKLERFYFPVRLPWTGEQPVEITVAASDLHGATTTRTARVEPR